MHTYRAYGLTINSAAELPELIPWTGAEAEVLIRRQAIDPTPPPGARFGKCGWATPDTVYLEFPATAAFRITAGREIVVEQHPGADLALERLLLAGTALAVLLHQRHLLVLHGSALVIGGAAVGFLGDKGAGKSTAAAFLHANGFPLITDDIIAVDLQANRTGLAEVAAPAPPNAQNSPRPGPVVWPGFPQIKLWPESLAAAGRPVDNLPRVQADCEKRAVRIEHNFFDGAIPLRKLYILTGAPAGSPVSIEPVNPQAAFMELVKNTFVATLLPATGDSAAHFHQCAVLLKQVPVATLSRPRDLARLPEMLECLERDLL